MNYDFNNFYYYYYYYFSQNTTADDYNNDWNGFEEFKEPAKVETKRKPASMKVQDPVDNFDALDVKSKVTKAPAKKSKEEEDMWEMLNS